MIAEYDRMDLEMLREVVPMLQQQLEKSRLDRNYVQLERVSKIYTHTNFIEYLISQPYQLGFYSAIFRYHET